MKKLTIAISLLLCVYFDSIFFARLNIAGIRPDFMLAVVVSYGVLLGSMQGALIGGIGGLVMDIIVGRYLGLNALLYLLAGVGGGLFYQKFYADNIIVPSATAMVVSVAKDIVFALIMWIMGVSYGFGWILVQYIIPCALFTGGVCLLVHLILKPLMVRQVKRRHIEHGR